MLKTSSSIKTIVIKYHRMFIIRVCTFYYALCTNSGFLHILNYWKQKTEYINKTTKWVVLIFHVCIYCLTIRMFWIHCPDDTVIFIWWLNKNRIISESQTWPKLFIIFVALFNEKNNVHCLYLFLRPISNDLLITRILKKQVAVLVKYENW